jgi:hypothetical protein
VGRDEAVNPELEVILRTDYSDAWPLDTQRRYHMPQRSPVVFWFLLVVTVSVDAVATAWLVESTRQPSPQALILFMAIAYAQVSILCSWAVLFRATSWVRVITPFVAGLIVALIISTAEMFQRNEPNVRLEQLLAFTALMWIHATVTCLLLWVLKPTRLFANYLGNSSHQAWRFTTKHLLILSTCLPVLVIVLKYSAIVRNGATAYGVLMFVSWSAANSVLLIAIAAVAQWKWNWFLKLAACLGVALAIGVFLHWCTPELSREFSLLAFSLIQTVVLWVWLELLAPCRYSDPIDADKSQPLELSKG